MDTTISPKPREHLILSRSDSLSTTPSTSGSSKEQLIDELLSRFTINDREGEDGKEGFVDHTYGIADATSFEEFEDKYTSIPTESANSHEQEAEEWLTRKKALMVSINWDERSPPHETHSTLSSPGKSSLRERLKYRLMKHNTDPLHQPPTGEKPKEVDPGSGSVDRTGTSADEDDDGHDDRYSDVRVGLPPPPPPQSNLESSMPGSDDILLSSRDDTNVTNHAFTSRSLKRSDPIPLTRPSTISPPQLNDSILRLSRTVRYGRRGELPVTRKINRIRLHIYDLIHKETVMRLPWGCDFPIGKCFQAMNNGLHALGTGAYHCGIEINGIEYAYGANELHGSTGVFTCMPKHSPGYEYRSTIDFGDRQVKKTEWALKSTINSEESTRSSYREVSSYLDGRDVMKEMASEYHGMDYDLLRKNCCTFAKDASLRLGVMANEIPQWFMNLADAGAKTRDFSEKAWEPISYLIPLGTTVVPQKKNERQKAGTGEGFEVIAPNRNDGALKVVDAVEKNKKVGKNIGVRRTLSWTY